MPNRLGAQKMKIIIRIIGKTGSPPPIVMIKSGMSVSSRITNTSKSISAECR